MARKAPGHNFAPVLSAAKTWIDRCLIGDGSVFTDAQLWTKTAAEQLRKVYVDKPDESDKKFLEKLSGQLKEQPQQVVQLAAEMLWALYLFPWGGRNGDILAATKQEKIREVWGWSGTTLPEDHELLANDVLLGIGGAGQNYKKMWHELAFLVRIACDLKKRPDAERRDLLTNYDKHVRWVSEVFAGEKQQFRHMLRYFAFPDKVERIASSRERVAMLDAFLDDKKRDISRWDDKRIDDELHKIRKQYEKDYPKEEIDFYRSPLLDAWGNDAESTPTVKIDHSRAWGVNGGKSNTIADLLEDSRTHAVLLFGPAGTGKTFKAKEVADAYGGLESDRVRLVQFHPAYAYEDFMEGLRPRSVDGQVVYRIRSGAFKAFCKQAKDSDNDYLFIIDEINRGNIAKVMGELMYCLEYRGEKHAITLPYSGDKFFIPDNVHILGTMNSSDRSIAMLDVALRRRFQFVELAPDPDGKLLGKVKIADTGLTAGAVLRGLNDRILPRQGRHKLIGHSYFMPDGFKKSGDGVGQGSWELEDLKARWFHQILPLLEEYFADDVQTLVEQIIGAGWGEVHDKQHFVSFAPDKVDFEGCLKWIAKPAKAPASGSVNEPSEDE